MVQQIKGEAPVSAAEDFDLDVKAVEVADAASLQVLTDDGCGSTCGACTTGVH
ncbi:FxLD family lanthipeptide [Kitasatospora aureofaciens]|uniref:FxLD family lanthipeptide n=1 Tax=Kitasatospora aureofaciens TaxID=1894 RepID=UPI001C46B55A|nr:FxLD family lanthipeptide [Kitasatospora aureofaciens]MBV6699400.1 FxLD family lanthipeptide [Kitasatospora aureofaciens]